VRWASRLAVAFLPLAPKALIWRVARRYVAGPTLADAVRTIQALNAEGACATVDILGEEVNDRARATAATEAYLEVFAAIREHGLDSNVSLKLTSLGLTIDEAFCLENTERIVAAAKEQRSFVRIDMEDRRCTDATLRIYRTLHQRHGHVGTVLQAYMRRTLDDITALPADANIRLCKGIYIEPRAAAWKGYDTVRANFLSALEKLLTRGSYVGIATHDEYLLCGACALVDRLGVPRHGYELQMLLGVEEELRRILIANGHCLRVYVPFGVDWYAYSVRRLRENPEIAGHVLRAMLGRRA